MPQIHTITMLPYNLIKLSQNPPLLLTIVTIPTICCILTHDCMLFQVIWTLMLKGAIRMNLKMIILFGCSVAMILMDISVNMMVNKLIYQLTFPVC